MGKFTKEQQAEIVELFLNRPNGITADKFCADKGLTRNLLYYYISAVKKRKISETTLPSKPLNLIDIKPDLNKPFLYESKTFEININGIKIIVPISELLIVIKELKNHD